ncbi:methyltransferase [Candidatus Woesearchaeota archaeon]|nr:methyltransferase [Candidatus Woesearchaeota archaeon]
MISKSRLAIELSKIPQFDNPKVKLEQYVTDSEIAAEILWQAYLEGDIKGKMIADFGAGTGIFSLGCILLGAKKVYAVEKDNDSVNIATKFVKSKKCEFVCDEIKHFDKKVDTVIQNPPYGTKEKHADKEFLMKAFEISKKIYSLHKVNTTKFVEKITENYGFKVKKVIRFSIPLKRSYHFHTKNKVIIDIGCWILEKR